MALSEVANGNGKPVRTHCDDGGPTGSIAKEACFFTGWVKDGKRPRKNSR
jgi:hypothetical protein